MRTYTVTNHNGTILGVFLNIKAAYREQLEYRAQTGNMAYVEEGVYRKGLKLAQD